MITSPKLILLIRHAEKNGDPSQDAPADGIHLSTRGQIRAAALAAYVPLTFPQVNYLFASQPSSHSNRPVETITPLAKTLGLQIDTQFRDADYASLAGEVLGQGKYVGKIVLVCWHHGEIPRLATALGIKQPRTWRGVVFDRVWSVDYAEKGPMLHDNPQMLLYGDSSS